ncbi:MAG: UvrD-helicase domain-containing protein, partial [Chloroflexota bacterium]
VARYASLLADGCSPRRVAAITFTKKAALEMRSRVRKAMTDLAKSALTDEERNRWLELGSQMDSARIGTIHSLCTEILKAHPAEARIDPRFEVMDEGLAAALQAVVVEDCLVSLVDTAGFEPLLEKIKIRDLRTLLTELLRNRLDTVEAFTKQVNSRDYLRGKLDAWFEDDRVSGIIYELRGTSYEQMVNNTGDKLADRILELLKRWDIALQLYKNNEPFQCAVELFNIRRNNLGLGAGKRNSSEYLAIAEMRELYIKELDPLLGGESSADEPLSLQAEQDFEILLPLLQKAFTLLEEAYRNALSERHALDFNDLEYMAQQLLLENPAIRAHWQSELESILVDEFQDTNARQRDIVEALAGAPGRLFLVGDSRQSIYRFRGADVTVFKGIKQKITSENGLPKELSLTYRAHEALLDVTGDLLATAMRCEEDPPPDFYIPFTPLEAFRKTPDSHWESPHLEIILGTGESAREARPVAARALVKRLLELKKQEQIKRWDDVVLLFRASTGFPFYEDAFEEAGVPFVTVSGKGFYSRPEIRDLLNMLRALSDPTDDLSMAGLLRSPAFGLTDAALYQLGRDGLGYLQALESDITYLNEADRDSAARALNVIHTLQPLVDRVRWLRY